MLARQLKVNIKSRGKGNLIQRLSMGQTHHRSTQVWHALSRDHVVLPATHAFIHELNESYLPLTSQLNLSRI